MSKKGLIFNSAHGEKGLLEEDKALKIFQFPELKGKESSPELTLKRLTLKKSLSEILKDDVIRNHYQYQKIKESSKKIVNEKIKEAQKILKKKEQIKKRMNLVKICPSSLKSMHIIEMLLGFTNEKDLEKSPEDNIQSNSNLPQTKRKVQKFKRLDLMEGTKSSIKLWVDSISIDKWRPEIRESSAMIFDHDELFLYGGVSGTIPEDLCKFNIGDFKLFRKSPMAKTSK